MAAAATSSDEREPGRSRTRGAVVLGLLAGAGYLMFVCPGIYWRDAGELSASAFGLGVAHPTGFPLYLLVAKLASLVPLGHIALRVNLLSAGCAACAVGLAYILFLRLAVRPSSCAAGAAAAGALLLAFGGTFWLHATTAEVYAPSLLAIVALLHLLLRAIPEPSARRPDPPGAAPGAAAERPERAEGDGSSVALRTAAALTGLGAGLHVAFALLAASVWLVALCAIWIRARGGGTGPHRVVSRELAWSAVLFSLGALVLAYLPIRAAQEPWRNWGDPATPGALWDHLTGARIRGAFDAEIGVGLLDVNLAAAVEQLAEQVGWVGLLAPIGLVVLALTRPVVALVVGAVFSADLLFTAILNPMGMADLQTGLSTTLATVAAAVVGAAFVGDVLVARAFRERTAAWLVFAAVLGLAVPAMVSGGRVRDTRRLHHPDYACQLAFDRAPPRALLLVSSDDMAAGTAYLQGVENRRPDCTTVVKQHAGDAAYIGHLVRFHGTEHLTARFLLRVAARADTRELLETLVAENVSRRPVFWELGDGQVDDIVTDRLRLDFPLSRLYGPQTGDIQTLIIDYRSHWREISGGLWPTTALRELARAVTIAGTHLLRAGDMPGARLATGEAFLTYSADPQVLTNYGGVLQMDGHHSTAEHRFRDAVELQPRYATGWYNLGTALFNRGEVDEAAEAFGESARLGATVEQAARMTWYMAIVHANRGDLELAQLLAWRAAELLRGGERRQAEEMLLELGERIRAGGR